MRITLSVAGAERRVEGSIWMRGEASPRTRRWHPLYAFDLPELLRNGNNIHRHSRYPGSRRRDVSEETRRTSRTESLRARHHQWRGAEMTVALGEHGSTPTFDHARDDERPATLVSS